MSHLIKLNFAVFFGKVSVEYLSSLHRLTETPKTIYLDKKDACRVAYYLDNDCLSYNFGRHPSGLSLCQLSDSDHMQHPGDLKKSSGFVYRGTKVH